MKTKTIEEIRKEVLKTIPFITTSGSELPIEMRSFDSLKKFTAAFKKDFKRKLNIKLENLIKETALKFNLDKWDFNQLCSEVAHVLNDEYDIFGASLYNESFFDFDKFYNWSMLYDTLDELKNEEVIPYADFFNNIKADVNFEMGQEIDLYEKVTEVLKKYLKK